MVASISALLGPMDFKYLISLFNLICILINDDFKFAI